MPFALRNPFPRSGDLRWADAYAFGTPTRYGNVSAQLKLFLDTTAGGRRAGRQGRHGVHERDQR